MDLLWAFVNELWLMEIKEEEEQNEHQFFVVKLLDCTKGLGELQE